MQKYITWVNNSLCHEIFMLLRWEVVWSSKH